LLYSKVAKKQVFFWGKFLVLYNERVPFLGKILVLCNERVPFLFLGKILVLCNERSSAFSGENFGLKIAVFYKKGTFG
jgi:hypothetical protein